MKKILTAITLLGLGLSAQAQLNPMGSMYYQNQYLSNPAMAGIESGWEINAGYKAQWTAIEYAPAMEAVTATHGSDNGKVGLGLNFFNDRAGVVQRTSVKASYAYHLPLNSGKSFLDFGLSAGIMDEWVDFNRIRGDLADASLYSFNQRSLYFDGDFGMAYRNGSLTVQGTLPNLKRLLERDVERTVADRSLYMAAVSYRFASKNGSALSSIEPKVVYRGVENYRDILDAGANLEFFGNKLLLSGMYHSTNSATIGAGTTYRNRLTILTQYTTNTSDLQSYSNGEVEIALKYSFK
ncbi:type IX secretion system membrane protein PorP/SprF [Pedobacter fastidiosus]